MHREKTAATPLQDEQLSEVAGGCSSCDYEMNPPGALDAVTIRGWMQIGDDGLNQLQHEVLQTPQ